MPEVVLCGPATGAVERRLAADPALDALNARRAVAGVHPHWTHDDLRTLGPPLLADQAAGDWPMLHGRDLLLHNPLLDAPHRVQLLDVMRPAVWGTPAEPSGPAGTWLSLVHEVAAPQHRRGRAFRLDPVWELMPRAFRPARRGPTGGPDCPQVLWELYRRHEWLQEDRSGEDLAHATAIEYLRRWTWTTTATAWSSPPS